MVFGDYSEKSPARYEFEAMKILSFWALVSSSMNSSLVCSSYPFDKDLKAVDFDSSLVLSGLRIGS